MDGDKILDLPLKIRMSKNVGSTILGIIITINLPNFNDSNGYDISAMKHHMTPSLMQDKLFNNNA